MRQPRAQNESTVLSRQCEGKLPVQHFFRELEADLGLSNPSRSPEKTRVPQCTIRTMNKNLAKLVKHIIPSNKQWAGVWFAGYRGLRLPFVRMDMVNIADKSAVIDEYILGVRKETLSRRISF